MTQQILYIGLHTQTLELLQQQHELTKHTQFRETTNEKFKEDLKALQDYQALLIGEEVDNPIQLAQDAFAHDKSISILLLNDGSNYLKIKQALQFSPFTGPTVQCLSNEIGERMIPFLTDAIQQAEQRRSFARIKNTPVADQRSSPNAFAKVKSDFTAKVLQEAPIGAVLISPSGLVFSINNYAVSIIGRSEREILGMPFSSYFPAEIRLKVKNFLVDGYLTEPKQVFEAETEGTTQYLELTVTPVNLDAAVNYKLVLVNNITQTVEAQQRTQQQLKELEELNTSLKRANDDLDTFVYTASHDLKSPILNIEGLMTMLEAISGTKNPEVKSIHRFINKSIRQFKLTIEELTEVSKIQRSVEQEAIKVDVYGVLKEVKELLEREIRQAEASIEFTMEGEHHIYFQKKNLTSILYNLINNAVKYSCKSRKPLIQVRAWHEENEFVLQVQDNGLGIPDSKKERIFQLFQRVHSHVQGSGVGLYIVKRIIENNHGHISVDSEVGVGSVFTVRLKKSHEHAATTAPEV